VPDPDNRETIRFTAEKEENFAYLMLPAPWTND